MNADGPVPEHDPLGHNGVALPVIHLTAAAGDSAHPHAADPRWGERDDRESSGSGRAGQHFDEYDAEQRVLSSTAGSLW